MTGQASGGQGSQISWKSAHEGGKVVSPTHRPLLSHLLGDIPVKRPIHSQLNWAILLCDVIPDGKNWVNCAVLTGSSAGLRTVLSSRLSHRELRSSLRESHSLLSLPADTTMASSQGTQLSSNSFSRWASHDIFLVKYHFFLHILRFSFLLFG
jgi:hypothetical protein